MLPSRVKHNALEAERCRACAITVTRYLATTVTRYLDITVKYFLPAVVGDPYEHGFELFTLFLNSYNSLLNVKYFLIDFDLGDQLSEL